MKKLIINLILCASLAPFNTNAQKIYEETFEGSTYFPLSGTTINKTSSLENANNNSIANGGTYDWTLTSVTSPVFQNAKAVKFEIRKDQPLVGTIQRIRSEAVIIKGDDYTLYS